jgi:hypothetical protein
VTGVLRRIGEHESQLGSQLKEYIEVELEMKDGSRANVSVDKGNATACLFFCKKLLEVAAGEAIAITVGKSKEPNDFGKYASFPKIATWRPISDGSYRWHEVLGEEFEGANSREKLIPCLEALESHPAWGPRASRSEDSAPVSTAFGSAAKAIKAKGWPDLAEAIPQYLALIEKACKVKYQGYADVPDTVWQQFAESVEKAAKVPASLQSVLDAKKNDEYDPFGDE